MTVETCLLLTKSTILFIFFITLKRNFFYGLHWVH
nr:MAG TPA: hypothetical protein [Caudoviricetes sp.]